MREAAVLVFDSEDVAALEIAVVENQVFVTPPHGTDLSEIMERLLPALEEALRAGERRVAS